MKDLRLFITDRKDHLNQSIIDEEFELINNLIHRNFNLDLNIIDRFDSELIKSIVEFEEINFYYLESIQWYIHLSDHLNIHEESLFMFVFYSILADAKLLHFDHEELYVPEESMSDDEEEEYECSISELMKQEYINRIRSSQIDYQAIIDNMVEFVDEYYVDYCDSDGTNTLFTYCVSSQLLYKLCKDKNIVEHIMSFLGEIEILNHDPSKTSYIISSWFKSNDYGNNDFNFSKWDQLNKIIKDKSGLDYTKISPLNTEKLTLLFSGNSLVAFNMISEVIKSHETTEEVMF